MTTPVLDDTFVTLHTLAMRYLGVLCYDWSGVLADPPKDGENRKLGGYDGTEPRARTRGELHAALEIRVSGEQTIGGVPVGRGVRDAGWVSQFYANLAELRAVTSRTGLTVVSLTRWDEQSSALCHIEDGGTPMFLNPWTAELVVDLTIPAGVLTLAEPPPSGATWASLDHDAVWANL